MPDRILKQLVLVPERGFVVAEPEVRFPFFQGPLESRVSFAWSTAVFGKNSPKLTNRHVSTVFYLDFETKTRPQSLYKPFYVVRKVNETTESKHCKI